MAPSSLGLIPLRIGSCHLKQEGHREHLYEVNSGICVATRYTEYCKAKSW